MADLLIKKTQRVVFRMDDATALCLLNAFPQDFERYEPKPKPQQPPEWRLRTSDIDQRVIGLTITIGAEVINIAGAAETMLERCARALAGRTAPLPSAELIAAYGAATGTPLDPEVVQELRLQRQLRDEQAMREQNKLSIPEVMRQKAAEVGR